MIRVKTKPRKICTGKNKEGGIEDKRTIVQPDKLGMHGAAEASRPRCNKRKRETMGCDLFKPDAKIVKDTSEKKYKIISLNRHIHVIRNENKSVLNKNPAAHPQLKDNNNINNDNIRHSGPLISALTPAEIETANFLASCISKRIKNIDERSSSSVDPNNTSSSVAVSALNSVIPTNKTGKDLSQPILTVDVTADDNRRPRRHVKEEGEDYAETMSDHDRIKNYLFPNSMF